MAAGPEEWASNHLMRAIAAIDEKIREAQYLSKDLEIEIPNTLPGGAIEAAYRGAGWGHHVKLQQGASASTRRLVFRFPKAMTADHDRPRYLGKVVEMLAGLLVRTDVPNDARATIQLAHDELKRQREGRSRAAGH